MVESMALELLFPTITTTFGLSNDLLVPVSITIDHLEAMGEHVSKSSEKYINPSIFKKLSNISTHSDMFVKVHLSDKFNTTTLPVQTAYVPFTKRREWKQRLELPISYNQLSYESAFMISIWEMYDSLAALYGYGTLSLFDNFNSALKTGPQKVRIHPANDIQIQWNANDVQLQCNTDNTTSYLASSSSSSSNNPETAETPEITRKINLYEKGELPRVPWLDDLVLQKVKQNEVELKKKASLHLLLLQDQNKPPTLFLHVDLPQFEMPIVFSDNTYNVTPLVDLTTKITSQPPKFLSTEAITSRLLKGVEISLPENASLKVYDPDFLYTTTSNISQPIQLDPIEAKYHKLERNINNNSLLDRDVKPSPQTRDQLLRILQIPSNIELNDADKNLIWQYRFYFSKNIAIPRDYATQTSSSNNQRITASKSTKNFLTKFLKSINWDNDLDLNHVFKELIPTYWSPDKIQIGDALELLGSYFNPYTLTSETKFSTADITKSGELRPQKIFPFVSFLRKFAVERLKLASDDELQLYLLQLVQALNYEEMIFGQFQLTGKVQKDIVNSSPLALFLIKSAVENPLLGNFFYWYIKVENEDQLKLPENNRINIYNKVLNTYIQKLKRFSEENKFPYYKNLKRQIWFIKKLTDLVNLMRTSFKKNEPTAKKVQFLRDHLADTSKEFISFPDPFPLPLDPDVVVCGCYPQESSVFKSSLAPLKITLKTIVNYSEVHMSSSSKSGSKDLYKYGKYPLMFKIGDDLRQDQLIIQIIYLMDQLLKNENLDLKLTPYKILATSPVAGLMQFIPNETLDSILAASYPPEITLDSPNNGILHYLRQHSSGGGNEIDEIQVDSNATTTIGDVDTSSNGITRELVDEQQHAITSDLGVSSTVMDNYVKSCAGYCVITYLLGVGDRHLDNLLLSPNGKFWHADFGYILGRDPKPFPPLMKLPIQVIDGMGGLNHENFNIFSNYCFITYTTLRKNSNLILNLFLLMLDANIPDIQIDPQRAIDKVEEKFCLEMSEEEAILHFQNLITDSVHALLPVVIDRLHTLAQYWRA